MNALLTSSSLTRPVLPPIVDSTMISCFRSCPRKYFYEFVLGLRPPGLSIDLHAGACFATAIENVYIGFWKDGLTLQEALIKAHAIFALAWGDFQIPAHKNTAKTFDRMWEAVELYFVEWHPASDHIQPYFASDGKPTFEYTFAIPLEHCVSNDLILAEGNYDPRAWGQSFPCHPSGEPFLYSGRLDMLGEWNGVPVGRDEKTAGQSAGQNWSEKWDLRSQFMGYCWALQQGGIPVETIAVRGIGILKTKIDFAEAMKTYSKDMLARWHEQLRRDLWRLRRCYDEGYFDYNLGDSCTSYGNCVFALPCSVPESEQAQWLSNYEVRHWNPLLKNPTEPPVGGPLT